MSEKELILKARQNYLVGTRVVSLQKNHPNFFVTSVEFEFESKTGNLIT